MENAPISLGSQSGVSMVRNLWWKGFAVKASFEFRMIEWRSDRWSKWRRERWVES